MKLKGSKAIRTKSYAEGSKLRVPHLDLPPEFGSENRRAIP